MASTTALWRYKAGRVSLPIAVCAVVAGVALVGPAAPASAEVTASGANWLWEGTATSVGNIRVDTRVDALPPGTTGKGVGIALIDTGVAPVPGLTTGNVINGPDLSFDSQDSTKRYIDGFGHGTHLAGIISSKAAGLTGLAPDAKLTSIKVGSSSGAVDVSQVIAAVDWTVAHRNDDPKNPIRVMTLAYGTDSVQKYDIDPLSAAVENAWRAGIVVVVSGGNKGGATRLLNPATNPFVLAVGAFDDMATTAPEDDRIASFTSRGDSSRRLDFAAPGRSVVSLRAPGSYIDTNYPSARIGTSFFLGSGSSQAAAVTAAITADLFQLYPTLTSDQMKYLLKVGTRQLSSSVSDIRAVSAYDAWDMYGWTIAAGDGSAPQPFAKSTGRGSLEASRGTVHVVEGTSTLVGENDIFGPFSTAVWATASANKTAWNGGLWMGKEWTGTGWVTPSAGLASWTGRAWSGRAWSGRAWSTGTWSSAGWLNAGWQ